MLEEREQSEITTLLFIDSKSQLIDWFFGLMWPNILISLFSTYKQPSSLMFTKMFLL